MKIAVVGSRGLQIDCLSDYIPYEIEEIDAIISGGARGIDTCAANFAKANGIPLVEIKPDYQRYGRCAPIVRNADIIDHADFVVVLWDKKSKGSSWVIDHCTKIGKPMVIHTFDQTE